MDQVLDEELWNDDSCLTTLLTNSITHHISKFIILFKSISRRTIWKCEILR